MAIKMMELAESKSEYLQKLTHYGIEKIGSGGFADVFQHPTKPNLVVRLGKYDRSLTYAYLTWCKANPSPYAPKVTYISEPFMFDPETKEEHDFKGPYTGSFFLAFIEKMKPVTEREVAEFMAAHYPYLQREQNDQVPWWVVVPAELDKCRDKNLRKVLTKIADLAEATKKYDMHPPNFLRRGNQLVFNDPVR